ncbi:vomeronasal type-2 receptor 26-like [Hyperolius riggenbachi]|uniref:vomeronasal type-2 receptor 26-like n=1 Tax=Hyperolius riggenbachi TaxID=752182 RepID=UPI0035A2A543
MTYSLHLMAYLLVGILILWSLLSSAHDNPIPRLCSLRGKSVDSHYKDGDLILGLLLDIFHTANKQKDYFTNMPTEEGSALDISSFAKYINYLAAMFAIDEINGNPQILPNVTLGFHAFDCYSLERRAMAGTLSLLSRVGSSVPNYMCHEDKPLAAVIGHPFSSISYVIAQLIGLYRLPQLIFCSTIGMSKVSYGATDPLLSDRVQFPTFYRTVPNYSTKHRAVVEVLKSFGWNWVGIIAYKDDSHQAASEQLRSEMIKHGICVEFYTLISEKASGTFAAVYEAIDHSTAQVIILYMGPVTFSFLFLLKKWQAKKFLFISCPMLSSFTDFNLDVFGSYFNGSLVLEFNQGEIPEFKDYVLSASPSRFPKDIFTAQVWREVFSCQTHNFRSSNKYSQKFCNINHTLGEFQLKGLQMDTFQKAYNVYLAVYSLAYGLHKMISKRANGKVTFKAASFHHAELNRYLKKIRLKMATGGDIFFDERGQFPGRYDIINWNIFENKPVTFKQVGTFDSSKPDNEQFFINKSEIVWPSIFNGREFNSGLVRPTLVRVTSFRLLQLAAPVSVSPQCKRYMFGVSRHPGMREFNSGLVRPTLVRVTSFRLLQLAAPVSVSPQCKRYMFGVSRHPGMVPNSTCSPSCPPGYRKALKEGMQICCYDCVRCADGEITAVPDMEDCSKCPEDQWSNKERNKCVMKAIEYLSYDDPLGLALASISILFSVYTVATLCLFIKNRHNRIVKANNEELSYSILVSLILCLLCPLLFLGKPRNATCLLRQAVFGVTFALCISCILGKTMTVLIAFRATRPGSLLRDWVGKKIPRCTVFICSLVEVIICICWLVMSPPYPDSDHHTHTSRIILHCNEGSTIALFLVVGYISTLAFVSFAVAYLARKLPDMFNEAQHITFSMLVFCCVWMTFIPTYLGTKGKYVAVVEIFCILASSLGLLGFIFVPKCWVILLNPEMVHKDIVLKVQPTLN